MAGCMVGGVQPDRQGLDATTGDAQWRHSDDPEQFRAEVRHFLAANLPEGWRGTGGLSPRERELANQDWRELLNSRGLLAAAWPREFGGADLDLAREVVLNEELSRVGLIFEDVQLHIGTDLFGQTLLAVGTDEQKKHFLPKILTGEHRWCQGFSEPGAGSDLAGLQTRAALDGDEWVVNGQKIWTSEAHTANWIFCLCRTDPAQKRNHGLSLLMIPMDQPGVEVRPILNINGSVDFNEVFLTDARTSREHVVGEVNDGWRVATVLLGFERGSGALADALLYRAELDRFIELLREQDALADRPTRLALAEAIARVEIMRYAALRSLSDALAGQPQGPEGSLHKLMWSEHHVALGRLAVDVLGLQALAPTGPIPSSFFIDLPGAPNSARSWVWTWLASHSDLIRGGTSDIQRNIVAERVLGLPREPRAVTGSVTP